MSRIYSFPPVTGDADKVLILGSMPSVRSLELGMYYGHPRNHFWQLMESILESPAPEAFEAKKAWLMAHGVALWDSACSCEREGSLDKDIKLEQPNDIAGFLRARPAIKAVFFNGIAAMKLHDKYNPRLKGVHYELLPSTSPVPRRHIKTAQDKLESWLRVKDRL